MANLNSSAPSYHLWNQLLQHYVDRQGRVDYQLWKAEASEPLFNWLEECSAVTIQTLTEDEQLTFWLNLYNALVIAQILPRYPIASIRPKVLGVPNWLQLFRFFSRPVFSMQGQNYSLNAIEHGIIRSQFGEPRIHFALVCAAIGCPLLRNEAYYPDRVGQQLAEDADRFINNPAKVHYAAAQNILHCSQIFKWYGKDFLTVSDSIADYLRGYFRGASELPEAVKVSYLPYDWGLNQQLQRTSS